MSVADARTILAAIREHTPVPAELRDQALLVLRATSPNVILFHRDPVEREREREMRRRIHELRAARP